MKAPGQDLAAEDYVQTNEQKRLNDARDKGIPWKKWRPYLSERQWGTVRERLNPTPEWLEAIPTGAGLCGCR